MHLMQNSTENLVNLDDFRRGRVGRSELQQNDGKPIKGIIYGLALSLFIWLAVAVIVLLMKL